MNTTRSGLEVRLRTRLPHRLPLPSDFAVVEVPVPDPAPGQVLVRNLFMSLDPGMLMLIAGEAGLPMPGYEVGAVMYGDAVGEVVSSADPALAAGDLVVHRLGWREFAVDRAEAFRRVERDALPSPDLHLGFGPVAYAGLVDAAGLRPGETVFVSSAAGATGGMAGQLARLLGAGRVIGSAGSPEKVAYLTERLGFDAAFDHHDGPVVDRLREAAPEGIDVYFDNVGGEQLRAAIEVMNVHGRVAVCGALNRQSTARPRGPRRSAHRPGQAPDDPRLHGLGPPGPDRGVPRPVPPLAGRGGDRPRPERDRRSGRRPAGAAGPGRRRLPGQNRGPAHTLTLTYTSTLTVAAC